MPYKETATNGNHYQEPTPDLVNSQPEWEVEQILGTRKRRQQLQYLVRWKGFSEAHDSWELLSNINADQLIQKFYPNHPSAICTSYKNPSLPSTITIQTINMSDPLSPLPLLTPSPPPLQKQNLLPILSAHQDSLPAPRDHCGETIPWSSPPPLWFLPLCSPRPLYYPTSTTHLLPSLSIIVYHPPRTCSPSKKSSRYVKQP
jgi:hypothetical protein